VAAATDKVLSWSDCFFCLHKKDKKQLDEMRKKMVGMSGTSKSTISLMITPSPLLFNNAPGAIPTMKKGCIVSPMN
jgi:hypothetical protein